MSEVSPENLEFILIKEDWISFKEDQAIPDEVVHVKFSTYNCDTGCTGWRIYHMIGDREERSFGFEFCQDEAMKLALEQAKILGITAVVEKDLGW